MAIIDEIFEAFFEALSKDPDFPDALVEELKKLYEQNLISSGKSIMTAIKKGCEDDRSNKEN
jgi:hypothetical protein